MPLTTLPHGYATTDFKHASIGVIYFINACCMVKATIKLVSYVPTVMQMCIVIYLSLALMIVALICRTRMWHPSESSVFSLMSRFMCAGALLQLSKMLHNEASWLWLKLPMKIFSVGICFHKRIYYAFYVRCIDCRYKCIPQLLVNTNIKQVTALCFRILSHSITA